MSASKLVSTSHFLLGALWLFACAAGCSSTEYAEKRDEVVEAPDEEVELDGLGTETWCSDFGQSGLDAVVQRTWAENMQLKAAWARLEQAEAAAEIAEAQLWPSVSAGADAEYSTRQFDGDFNGQNGGGSNGEWSWSLSAAASYEVDIWGRYRHLATAADLEAEAAEARARSLTITLTSQVAEAWFDVITQRERVELLESQLEISQDTLAIIKRRLRRGLASAIDAAQQEQNIESIQAELAEARGQLAISRHRLAVLVGEPPGGQEYVGDEDLPEITPLPEAGVPADLLARRPDLRASYLLLEAADERTAAAVANQLPRLRLSASIGFQAEQIASLFEQLFWSIGAGVSQPIFEGGRLRAEVDLNEAIAKEQLYNYAETLLVAVREVRDAVALELTERERIERLERELQAARDAVDLARRRYRTGAADYLRVLTGLQGLQDVERTLLTARRQQISNRIALCRALGGSWVDSVEPSIETDD